MNDAMFVDYFYYLAYTCNQFSNKILQIASLSHLLSHCHADRPH